MIDSSPPNPQFYNSGGLINIIAIHAFNFLHNTLPRSDTLLQIIQDATTKMPPSDEICGARNGTSLKRSRRWFATAIVVVASAFVEMESTSAFSPSSSEFRSHAHVESRSHPVSDDAPNKRVNIHGVDLHVAMSPDVLGIHGHTVGQEKPKIQSQRRKKNRRVTKVSTNSLGLSTSSRAVPLSKRNSRMTRPQGRGSSPRIDSKPVASDHSGLLDKSQERKLTVSIRSLRRAIRIRDELVENSDSVPSEGEWAAACDLTVIGLRRAMYEGQQARTVLVSANAGLVTAIAKRQLSALKYATEAGGGVGTILTLQDLIQEGNLGLMQAAERFEAARGYRFSTYATYWIKQRILRAISDSSRIIRLPAHVHSMLQKINKARKEVAKEIGRTPSTQEVAQYLEVSVDELEKYTSRTRNVVSLESPLYSGGSLKEDRRTIGDLIQSDAPTPEEDVQRKSLKDDIKAVMSELAEHERQVLMLRFGLESGEPMTATQTAKQLSISVDRVRHVETRALNKLRSPQRNYRLKEYIGEQATIEEEQIIDEIESTPEKIWFF